MIWSSKVVKSKRKRVEMEPSGHIIATLEVHASPLISSSVLLSLFLWDDDVALEPKTSLFLSFSYNVSMYYYTTKSHSNCSVANGTFLLV